MSSTRQEAVQPSRRRATSAVRAWGYPWLVRALVVLGVPALVLLAYWNAAGLIYTITNLPRAGTIGDWFYWGWVDQADPYAWDWVRWSPPAVWAWLSLIRPLGIWVVIAAHVAALVFLKDWRVILAVLLAWPFWEDALNGTTLTFAFVAAWTALSGSRVGTLAFLAQAVLIPRPLMLPVLAWLLWKRPETRLWFAACLVGLLIASAATGHLAEWLARLPESTDRISASANLGPSAWLGPLWIPIGLTLGIFLTLRERLGLASIVVSPYLYMYYLLFVLLELHPRIRPSLRLPQRRSPEGKWAT
jgi:hypothetical protein